MKSLVQKWSKFKTQTLPSDFAIDWKRIAFKMPLEIPVISAGGKKQFCFRPW